MDTWKNTTKKPNLKTPKIILKPNKKPKPTAKAKANKKKQKQEQKNMVQKLEKSLGT